MTAHHHFLTAQDATDYTLARKGKITLTSRKTERWFTYRINQDQDRETGEYLDRYFVSVLSGPDNWANYSYIGMIGADRIFRHTKGSKVAADSPSFRAFRYFWQHATLRDAIPADLQVQHCNTCGRCGRLLTTPDSISRGIGPECWQKTGS